MSRLTPNRCAKIAALCTGQPDRVRRLASMREPVELCGPCEEAATRLGMDPSPVPEWIARGVTGKNHAKDLTGAVA